MKLLVLDGDGIGPEVIAEGLRILELSRRHAGVHFELDYGDFGGASIDRSGVPVTDSVLRLAKASDAVLLGAVGGPKWDHVDHDLRPEKGLLRLRAELEVFANLRPATFFSSLSQSSPLRPELTSDVDLLIIRELVSGIYFGEPRGIDTSNGQRRGYNTLEYNEDSIRRVARVAFEAAKKRDGRLTSVDKANVLEVMRLWREVVTELSPEYPEVELEHIYVDNCAMQLVTNPRQYDVLVTGNMFGDILSDAAAALTGSLGMLPSASLGDGGAIYEPVHGSAPDIAGRGEANPLAMILSVAMLFEHTLGRKDLARALEGAVDEALSQGLRTADIVSPSGSSDTAALGERLVSCSEMGEAVGERFVCLLTATTADES